MSVILTRQLSDVVPGTVQVKLPSLAVEETIVVHEAPLLREYSIFTLPTGPMKVQVILWLEPVSQYSPPLGEVIVIKAGS
jgi:hypothetical protein